ncbi:MAG: site-2 protease family protein [Nanoarchaeota archaeon]
MAIGFIIYDIVFLIVFTLAVVLFLYKKKSNLKREGLLYLYRTKVGIKFIEWTSKTFPRTLYYMQYIVIISGYTLMISMIFLLAKFSYFYITSPVIAKALKVPVIIPLIPYLPEIFKLDFLPPFYFTYWIIIIAIIAIPHEFAHGIFARLNKIKIHSTGFGFLGPFLAAFVEPDEKNMAKAKKFSQLSILGSGTFANILCTIVFGLLFWLFFASVFQPAGVVFNSYAMDFIPLAAITSVNNMTINSLDSVKGYIDEKSKFTEVKLRDDNNYFVSTGGLIGALDNNQASVIAVLDSPAFRAELSGAIKSINGVEIKNLDELRNELDKYNARDKIKIVSILEDKEKEYNIELGEFNGKSLLGIGFIPPQSNGVMGWLYGLITKIKDPFVYYQSNIGNIGIFIYHLLWWIVLINISVALVNMLPLGIFDGGRFFYLTVLCITGSEKIAKRAFKTSTYLMLALIAALMVKWLFIFV